MTERPTLTQLFLEVERETPISIELLLAIRRIMTWELRRRGAGNGLLPSHFGLMEWERWSDIKKRSRGSSAKEVLFTKGPVNDLSIDCYEYAVLSRYDSLRTQLGKKDNVDGLIRLNVKHFLTERQRQNDPYGTATYRNFKAVMENWLATGEAKLEDGPNVRDGKIRILSSRGLAEGIASLDNLDDWVRTAGGLQTARAIGESVSEGIQGRWSISMLSAERDFELFWFQDALKVWKGWVRKAAGGIRLRNPSELAIDYDAHNSDGEIVVKYEDQAFGLFEEFNDGAAKIARARLVIETAGFQKRVQDRLLRLLNALKSIVLDEHDVPSQAEMARRLNISTSTYSDDLQRLREIFEDQNSDI